MPTFHKFKRTPGDNRGLTDDRTGAKLPTQPGQAWTYEKDVTINPGDPLIGADPAKVIADIAKDGYYIYPVGR